MFCRSFSHNKHHVFAMCLLIHHWKKSGAKMAPPWSRFGKQSHVGGWNGFFLNNHVLVKDGASDQSGTNCQNSSTVEPFSIIFQKKGWKWYHFSKSGLELKWLLLRKCSHNHPFFGKKTVPLCKVVLKLYLKGGHPVDMKMAIWAPLFSFGDI